MRDMKMQKAKNIDEDAQGARTQRPRRLDEVALGERQRLGIDDARDLHPADESDDERHDEK